MPERLVTARALTEAMIAVAPEGIRTACRAIDAGDQALLTFEEAQSIASIVAQARDASGAARTVARQLLQEAGMIGHSILKSASGAPVWPADIVGSMAHDGCFAVAAVAPTTAFSAIGIDVEPAEALPQEIVELVVTRRDRVDGIDPELAGRLLFSAKEAVYKAVFPRDGQVLGYEDIAIDLPQGCGTVVGTGRRLPLVWCLAPRIAVIAFEPGG